MKKGINYLHLPVAGSRVTVAMEQIDDRTIACAMAYCSPKDMFCRKKGRRIATQRLLGHYKVFFAVVDQGLPSGIVSQAEMQLRYHFATSKDTPKWLRTINGCDSAWLGLVKVIGGELQCEIGIEENGRIHTDTLWLSKAFLQHMLNILEEWRTYSVLRK